MARFQEMIYRLKRDDKNARFDTPLSGAIEIGVDEESDEKGQVVHIPLVFQPEALEEAIQEYTTELVLLGHIRTITSHNRHIENATADKRRSTPI